MLSWLRRRLAPARHRPAGVAISAAAQQDLDYLFRKTGLRAHKVGPELRFNAHILAGGDAEGERIEALLWQYAEAGYVFTTDPATLFGRVCAITTPPERVAERRNRIRLVKKPPPETST